MTGLAKNTKVVKIKLISELWSPKGNMKKEYEKGISNTEHRTPNFEVGAFGLAEYRTSNTKFRSGSVQHEITTECLVYPAISAFGVRYSFF